MSLLKSPSSPNQTLTLKLLLLPLFQLLTSTQSSSTTFPHHQINLHHPSSFLSLRITPPILPPLNFTTAQSSIEHNYHSHWSCFGDTMQIDGWRATTCHLKNACYDMKQQEFVVFNTNNNNNTPKKGSSKINSPPPDVSLGVFNYKWFTRYDPIFRIKFKVIETPNGLLPDHYRLPEKELWIPHLPFAPSNIGHLIWDDYLAWFNVAWNILPSSKDEYALRPLWLNPNDPPWATCDWIREHEGPGHNLATGFSNRCLNNNRKWLNTILGVGNTVQPEAKIGPGKRIGPQSNQWLLHEDLSKSNYVCFPELVLGLGTMSNQGTGLHGWNIDDTVPTCSGRGPLFWEFRQHMMKMMNAPDVSIPTNELLIFFSSHSSDRIFVSWDTHMALIKKITPELEHLVEQIVGRKINIVVECKVLSALTPAQQASLAARSAIYVTVAGGGALTAQFLSRGAGLIIYHENQEQIHDGFVDWKIWNFLTSWIRSNWFLNKIAYDLTVFEKVLREEVLLCARFWVPIIGNEE
jgi:hypothetical protein